MSVVTEFVSTLKGHKWQISCLEFKSTDSTVYLASGSWDKTARIWDLSECDACTRLKSTHDGAVTSLSWCQRTYGDFNILATTSADKTACLWNSKTGKSLAKLSGHDGWVLDCSFSADSRTLATASWDSNIKLWDVETKRCVRSLEDHESGVWTCKYHTENPNIICSGSEDGSLRVWDARATTSKFFGGHDDSIKACSWSPSGGDYLVSGSSDSTVILWDFRQKVALTKCCGHEAPVSDVKFYPLFGKKRYPFLLSSGDYSVRMWHPLTSSKELLKLKQHTFGNEVETIAISDDGTLLASGGLDNQIVLTAMAVPIDQLEDMPVDLSDEPWTKAKTKERKPSDSLDECDGLPHRDKNIEKLLDALHHNKKEHLIVPPVSSAASLVECALERKDSKNHTSSSSSNEHTVKKGVKSKKKGQKKQRPRSFVLSNGNHTPNSLLNAELSKKLATLKKTRSGSDPIPVDMVNGNKDHRSKKKFGQSERERDEIEAISRDMMTLVKELETTSKEETSL